MYVSKSKMIRQLECPSYGYAVLRIPLDKTDRAVLEIRMINHQNDKPALLREFLHVGNYTRSTLSSPRLSTDAAFRNWMSEACKSVPASRQ